MGRDTGLEMDNQALFWGENFKNAKNSSFERAPRAESNDTKCKRISQSEARL